MVSPPSPTASFAAIFPSLSSERLAGYSTTQDYDSTDLAARYLYNAALSAAFGPILQTVEIGFRNALYEAGCETTAGRRIAFRTIDCWLDADPPLLQAGEDADVQEAVGRLQLRNRLRPGHLVSQLGFGFWLRLCNAPYEHGQANGPQLWPHAARRFPNCPRSFKHRHALRSEFAKIRDWRNLIAHHQPIWDRAPQDQHDHCLRLLDWMNRDLARVLSRSSPVPRLIRNGPAQWRAAAEQLVAVCV